MPAGRYWAISDFSQGNSQRLVVLPQFTVRGNTTVRVAERSATSKLTLSVPRPAQAPVFTLTITRGGPHGAPAAVSDLGQGISIWVNPIAVRPTFGTLQWYTAAQLLSPPKAAGAPYVYNLDYPAPAGTIPSLDYRVTSASLATVSERYDQDVRSTGAWFTEGGPPAQQAAVGGGWVYPIRLPGRQTQYMSADPATTWLSNYNEFVSSYSGGQYDSFRVLRAGQRLTEDWNQYPLGPQPDVSLLHGSAAGLFPVLPSAFRAGNTLSLDVTPFSDNQFGHNGSYSLGQAGTYAIKQDGVTLASGNAVNGIAPVRLSAKPSVISFTLTASRPFSSYPLSSASATTWTWRTAPRPRAVVPAGWYCGTARHGRLLRSCAVQPMLTLSFQVQDLALDGSAPAGRQVVSLSTGHVQLATAAPVTRATAQVSFNDGQTWQAATVSTAGRGRFRIGFTAPAGVDVTLRVSAASTSGDSITETILRGYRVGS